MSFYVIGKHIAPWTLLKRKSFIITMLSSRILSRSNNYFALLNILSFLLLFIETPEFFKRYLPHPFSHVPLLIFFFLPVQARQLHFNNYLNFHKQSHNCDLSHSSLLFLSSFHSGVHILLIKQRPEKMQFSRYCHSGAKSTWMINFYSIIYASTVLLQIFLTICAPLFQLSIHPPLSNNSPYAQQVSLVQLLII